MILPSPEVCHMILLFGVPALLALAAVMICLYAVNFILTIIGVSWRQVGGWLWRALPYLLLFAGLLCLPAPVSFVLGALALLYARHHPEKTECHEP